MKSTALLSLSAAALAACSPQGGQNSVSPDDSAISDLPARIPSSAADATTPVPTDAWIGKWVGVEGLALDIEPGGAPGKYRLHIALLDGASDYDGTADAGVIRFTRDGKAETIRKATGAETGLKWLADKKNCLMIQPGEGFCRD